MHNVSSMTVAVAFPDGDAIPPHRVQVTVTYTFIPYLSNFITAPTMQTYAEGRMVVQ
jgi:hypothetical protein